MPVPPPSPPPQVRSILEGIAVAAKYPQQGASYGGAPPADREALSAAADEAEAVADKRRELFTLFRNTGAHAAGAVAGAAGLAEAASGERELLAPQRCAGAVYPRDLLLGGWRGRAARAAR